jgi:hypothetical protein
MVLLALTGADSADIPHMGYDTDFDRYFHTRAKTAEC